MAAAGWAVAGGAPRWYRWSSWRLHRTVVVLLAGSSGTVGCGPDRFEFPEQPDHRRITYMVVDDQSFGWAEMPRDHEGLDSASIKASAGVIARPLNVVERADSTVVVLDADFHKIAVFAWDGDFEGVIRGGYGLEPGNFARPGSMDVAPDGSIFVLDDFEGRIHEFDPSGGWVQTFAHGLGNAVELVAADRGVYVSRFFDPDPGRPLVVAIDRRGQRVDSLAPSEWQDSDLGTHSEKGALGKDANGRVMYAYPAPAVWTYVGGPSRVGVPFYPDARGYIRTSGQWRIQTSPVGSRGVTTLPSGEVVVFYQEKTPDENRYLYLDVLSPRGEYLGSAELEDDLLLGRMSGSRYGPFLYFTVHGDQPGGKRVRLMPLKELPSEQGGAS